MFVQASLAFEQHAAQVSETVEVKLPRGPASYCSPRVNGKLPKGTLHIRRNYAVTIEPNARSKLLRRVRNVPTENEDIPVVASLPPLPTPSALIESNEECLSGRASPASDSPMPPAIMSALVKRQDYYARVGFRQQRAKVFEAKKGFPALVNAKLVPEWRECNPHHSEEEIDSHIRSSPRRRAQARLVAPTLAGAVRQQLKRPPSPPLAWHPHNGVGEVQRMCSRTPCLFDQTYRDPAEMVCRNESPEAKRHWVAEHTILPPSLTQAKSTIARPAGRHGLEVEQEINEIRNRGRCNLEALQSRYERKAEAFKDEQARRGHLSSFDSYELRDKQKKKEDIAKKSEIKLVPRSPPEDLGFKERMSMGFSRYRLSRLQLPSDTETS